ncbi:MAG: hypothetical protein JNL82_23015 [Myxococcales bacterium]|nr:hypothetical protein [Myxococcales bacterium]
MIAARRGSAALAVGLALGLATCEPTVLIDDCEALCAAAARCGFLPSSLGGHAGDGDAELRADCLARCANTLVSAEVAELRTCLEMAQGGDVCSVDECVDVAACVHARPLADEVLGRVDVTMRLLDGVYWSTIFRPEVCDAQDDPAAAGYGLAELCAARVDPAPCADGGYCCADASAQPPLCGPRDCEQDRLCDPRLCSRTFVGGAADCHYYGVESVQFAYVDPSGALQIDPRELTCEQASAGALLHDLPHGLVVPAALLRGHISPQAAADLARPELVGREFCWTSTASDATRLTRAGLGTMVLPTVSADQLRDDVVERDATFPVGCACVFATIGCEVGAACANDLDDDADGLVDAEDPGCAPPGQRKCGNGLDDDGDGLVDADDPDCRR